MVFTLNLFSLTISGLEAVLAHPDWLLSPAQLRYWHFLLGTRITKSITTFAAVVNGVKRLLTNLAVL